MPRSTLRLLCLAVACLCVACPDRRPTVTASPTATTLAASASPLPTTGGGLAMLAVVSLLAAAGTFARRRAQH